MPRVRGIDQANRGHIMGYDRIQTRQGLIAKIHIGKSQIGMDDDSYRAMLARHSGGKTSCRDLDIGMLEAVLRELTGKGFTPRQPKAGRDLNPAEHKARLMGKITALLAEKARLQRHPVPVAYADALAQRLCRVERVEWCNPPQLGKIVAALAYDNQRMTQRLAQDAAIGAPK